jgi:GH25 family lysozyme M1 (1,4-beta-N-acetylmuramidase)
MTNFIPTPTDTTRVWGADVDQYTGIVDFSIAKKNGMNFVIIKCMDGTVKSEYFDENLNGAIANGIPIFLYCWLYASQNISSSSQANDWWNVIQPIQKYILGTWVDFEWTYFAGKQSNPTYKDLYGVIEDYKNLSGQNIGIYTASGYWNEYGSTDSYWSDKMLWIAQYGSNPKSLSPFGSETFWQFTRSADASLVGIPKDQELAVDMNYFNGSIDDFNKKFNIIPNPQPIQNLTHSLDIYSNGNIKEIK